MAQNIDLEDMRRRSESEDQETVALALIRARSVMGRAVTNREMEQLKELHELPEDQRKAASSRYIRTGAF